MVDEVVRNYHKAGFTILALTDHDKMEPNAQFTRGRIDWTTFEKAGTPFPKDPKPENYPFNTTWPWTDFGGPDPKSLGMVGIESAEISYRHHMNSFFSSYGTGYTAEDEDEQLTAMKAEGGLVFFNHPGSPAPFSGGGRRSLEWYAERFQKYGPEFLIGLDISGGAFTEGLWDQLLARFMPGRTIYGFATDDMHRLPKDVSKSPHTIFVLDKLNSASVRQAMEGGQFYFSRPSERNAMAEFPTIESIEVNEKTGTITIHALKYDTIRWISAPSSTGPVTDPESKSHIWPAGQVVHEGATLNYRQTPNIKNYVRAEIRRTEGGQTYRTFINAFGIREGNENSGDHKSIKIGNQEWMTENLNVDHFKNGSPIPEAKSNEEWIKAYKEGKPAWCFYDFKPEMGKKYGRLYNWYAVNDSTSGGVAPQGWHVPTKEEWTSLTDYLGGNASAGTKMKSVQGWLANVNGTNMSGFSALPGGYRRADGHFGSAGQYGYWWSSSPYITANAWSWIFYYNDNVIRTNHHKASGLSVRCIRD